MKVSKSQLKKIIKEELDRLIEKDLDTNEDVVAWTNNVIHQRPDSLQTYVDLSSAKEGEVRFVTVNPMDPDYGLTMKGGRPYIVGTGDELVTPEAYRALAEGVIFDKLNELDLRELYKQLRDEEQYEKAARAAEAGVKKTTKKAKKLYSPVPEIPEYTDDVEPGTPQGIGDLQEGPPDLDQQGKPLSKKKDTVGAGGKAKRQSYRKRRLRRLRIKRLLQRKKMHAEKGDFGVRKLKRREAFYAAAENKLLKSWEKTNAIADQANKNNMAAAEALQELADDPFGGPGKTIKKGAQKVGDAATRIADVFGLTGGSMPIDPDDVVFINSIEERAFKLNLKYGDKKPDLRVLAGDPLPGAAGRDIEGGRKGRVAGPEGAKTGAGAKATGGRKGDPDPEGLRDAEQSRDFRKLDDLEDELIELESQGGIDKDNANKVQDAIDDAKDAVRRKYKPGGGHKFAKAMRKLLKLGQGTGGRVNLIIGGVITGILATAVKAEASSLGATNSEIAAVIAADNNPYDLFGVIPDAMMDELRRKYETDPARQRRAAAYKEQRRKEMEARLQRYPAGNVGLGDLLESADRKNTGSIKIKVLKENKKAKKKRKSNKNEN